ncbi:hypothetical protein QRK96_004325 [Escherichia coli]|nr:hypothetical protein [Escherichia coli]ELR7144647.1 hypothetical protein [Escherichia coli]
MKGFFCIPNKWALVAILVPFLLVGCVSLDKARQLFDTASQVCQLIDGVQRCAQNYHQHYSSPSW